MSGAANLTLSLMDRTQLPQEWEVGERETERGEGREPTPTPPPLLSPFSLFLLFFFPVAWQTLL